MSRNTAMQFHIILLMLMRFRISPVGMTARLLPVLLFEVALEITPTHRYGVSQLCRIACKRNLSWPARAWWKQVGSENDTTWLCAVRQEESELEESSRTIAERSYGQIRITRKVILGMNGRSLSKALRTPKESSWKKCDSPFSLLISFCCSSMI